MRKICEHRAFEVVGHFQSILESAGISTLVKNEGISQGEGVLAGGDFYPELWVMDDADYDKAIEVLRPIHDAFVERSTPGLGADE